MTRKTFKFKENYIYISPHAHKKRKENTTTTLKKNKKESTEKNLDFIQCMNDV